MRRDFYMDGLFEMIVRNSIIAVFFILVILTLRAVTKNYSKRYAYVLWLLLLAELIMPAFVGSSLSLERGLLFCYSLWNQEEAKSETDENFPFLKDDERAAGSDRYDPIMGNSFFSAKEHVQKEEIQVLPSEQVKNPVAGEMEVYAGNPGLSERIKKYMLEKWYICIWAAGVVLLLLVHFIQFSNLRKMTKEAVWEEGNIWKTYKHDIPFVMFGLHPKIYIPFGLEGDNRKYIIEHEKQHIRHGDIWVKAVWNFVVILHWFNPFVWLAFHYMDEDMEMLCDECVLRKKSLEEKKKYSYTLLDFSSKRSGLSLFPSFGESNTENRIKHILYSKRPKVLVSVLLCMAIFICIPVFFTFSKSQNDSEINGDIKISEIKEEEKDTGSQLGIHENNREGNIEHDQMLDSLKRGKIIAVSSEMDEDFLRRIETAADYSSSEDWKKRPVITEDIFDTEEEQNIKDAVNLIGKTENFRLYGTNYIDTTIVALPDGNYIKTNTPFTSNYEVQPQIMETDFDGDGENELAVIIYIMHGTGTSIKQLFMVDKGENGKYVMFEYAGEEYFEAFAQHYETRLSEKGAALVVDGVVMGGIEADVQQEDLDSNYQYSVGAFSDFRFIDGNGIKLEVELVGYSDVSVSGHYTGHMLAADVVYQGDGIWKLENIRYYKNMGYYNQDINDCIENGVPLYYRNDEDFYTYYATEDFEKLIFDPVQMEATVLSIVYAENFTGGEHMTAYAAVRYDEEESLDYLTIEMEKGIVNDVLCWRISSISIEK